MIDLNHAERILRLYDNLVVFVNIKDKIVTYATRGERVVAKDLNYDEFVDRIQKRNDFDEETKGKLERFLKNLDVDDRPFSVNANYSRKDGSLLRFEIKGQKVSEDTVILSFENVGKLTDRDEDNLTRLKTKSGIEEAVNDAIKNNKEFALMVVTLDNFEEYEQTYGTMLTDIVLVEAASSLKKYIADNGLAARISHNSFLVLYYVKNLYSAVRLACDRIRSSAQNLRNHNIKQIKITATIGCANYPRHGETFETLYKKAFLALERGQRKGGGCFIIYIEDRCGNISTLDENSLYSFENTIRPADETTVYFNIIGGVFELLNRGLSFEHNMEDALSLIGYFFNVDRAALIMFDPDDYENDKVLNWTNPAYRNIVEFKKNLDHKKIWIDGFGSSTVLKANQIASIKNSDLKEILTEQNVTSYIAIKLEYEDKLFGFLRLDMCHNNRFWTSLDISSLFIIAKSISSTLNKNYSNIKLDYTLHFDKLTKIYNYSKWRDEIDLYLNSKKINQFSLISINFESFKYYNDSLGTKICDNALKCFAKGLIELSKDGYIYCRVSSDLFTIMIPSIDKDLLIKYVDDIQNYLYDHYSYGNNFKLRVGIYIDESEIMYKDDDYLALCIDKANIARKNTTVVNRIAFFDEKMFEDKRRDTELELHMLDAVNDGEFLLYLQPKVNTITNSVVGAEALTRWDYRHKKILTPNFFIPLFERNGFINQLDLIVFENVCKFQRDVLDKGLKPVVISVNLSMFQKDFPLYRSQINKIREKYDVPANLIEIEITESMYITNSSQIMTLMHDLHNDGYSISMDDFGSGYSNLASLSRFEFDTIKLDKSFVDDGKNDKTKLILTFIMDLAHSLNIKVLCEGVETKELVDYLRSIGCILVQGYYFDKPIYYQDFEEKYLKRIIKNTNDVVS